MDVEDGIREWGEVLYGITPAQMQRGIDQSRLDHKTWPPTPGEFYEVAMGNTREHAIHRKYQALPRPKANKQNALKQICIMKQSLRGNV